MPNRWKEAQEAEFEWWTQVKGTILSPKYRSQIKDRAKRVENWLKKFILIKEDSNILEIGGGATQLIDFFIKGKKYALDPLADLYQQEFSDVLNPEVKWAKGRNEELPYKNNFFDVIISRNVLDHVDSVEKCLSETYRVLKKEGVLYLGLNTFSGPLYLYKSILKNIERPFVFTPKKIRTYLKKANFKALDSILDAPENMSHFGQLESKTFYKAIPRRMFIYFKCYHFNEFILKK